jgi:hypothetical protein
MVVSLFDSRISSDLNWPAPESLQIDMGNVSERGFEKVAVAHERSTEKLGAALERSAEKVAAAHERGAEGVAAALERGAEKVAGAHERGAEKVAGAHERGAEKVAAAHERGAEKMAAAHERGLVRLLGNSLQQSAGLVVCVGGYATCCDLASASAFAPSLSHAWFLFASTAHLIGHGRPCTV